MKKILITGADGFLASRFIKTYSSRYEILGTTIATLDVSNEEKVFDIVRNFQPDYIVHAAGITATDLCEKNPELAHNVNVNGVKYICEASKEVGARVVFLSTEMVFAGVTDGGPYNEETTPVSNTVYGQTKIDAEAELKKIVDNYVILRLTWQFGLPEKGLISGENILKFALKTLIDGKPVKIPTNEYRGLTYIYEIIEQFEKVLELPTGTYHIGSHNNLSRYDYVKEIFKLLGREDRVNELLIPDSEKYESPRDIRLSTNKIRSHGIEFTDGIGAIKKCLDEFNFNI